MQFVRADGEEVVAEGRVQGEGVAVVVPDLGEVGRGESGKDREEEKKGGEGKEAGEEEEEVESWFNILVSFNGTEFTVGEGVGLKWRPVEEDDGEGWEEEA